MSYIKYTTSDTRVFASKCAILCLFAGPKRSFQTGGGPASNATVFIPMFVDNVEGMRFRGSNLTATNPRLQSVTRTCGILVSERREVVNECIHGMFDFRSRTDVSIKDDVRTARVSGGFYRPAVCTGLLDDSILNIGMSVLDLVTECPKRTIDIGATILRWRYPIQVDVQSLVTSRSP